jgi:hypothetical protein
MYMEVVEEYANANVKLSAEPEFFIHAKLDELGEYTEFTEFTEPLEVSGWVCVKKLPDKRHQARLLRSHVRTRR